MGNYKGWGDSKIVPRVDEATMEAFLKATAAYEKDSEEMEKLWSLVKGPMFCLKPGTENLGFPEKVRRRVKKKNFNC